MDPSKTSAAAEGAEDYDVTAAALCVHWVRVMQSCMVDGFTPSCGFGGEGIVQLDEEQDALAAFLQMIFHDKKYCGFKDTVFIVNDFFMLKVSEDIADAYQPKRDCEAFAKQAAISINNILEKLAGGDGDVAMMSHVWWLAGRFWYWAIAANVDPHFPGSRQAAIENKAFALPMVNGRMPANAITQEHWQGDDGTGWREDYNPSLSHGMVAYVRLGLASTDQIILVEFSVHPTYVSAIKSDECY
jgi:hypothetical protein